MAENISLAGDMILTLADLTDLEEENRKLPVTGRQRVDKWLNQVSVHVIIVIAVFLDLLLVTFLLLINLQVIQTPSDTLSIQNKSLNDEVDLTDSNIDTAEQVLHISQIVILSIFLLEIIIRVLCRGLSLLDDKLQKSQTRILNSDIGSLITYLTIQNHFILIFDGLVVLVTFALYVSLTAAVQDRTVTYSIGFIIVLRLWRIARIYTGVRRKAMQQERVRLYIANRKTWKRVEEHVKASNHKLEQQQKEIDILKEQVGKYRQNSKYSPGVVSSVGYSVSEDVMTSEDDFDTESTDAVLETVDVEQSDAAKPTQNGSIPNGESRERLSNGSVPGTPKSISSAHTTGEYKDSVTAEASGGKIPDIVEDTHEAHARQCKEQESKPFSNLKTETVDEDESKLCDKAIAAESSGRDSKTSDIDLGSNPNIEEEEEAARNIKDTKEQSDIVGQSENDRHEAECSGSGQTTKDKVKQKGRKKALEKAAGSPHLSKKERQKLLAAADAVETAGRFSYTNTGFEDSLTDEELNEILRISQVPFGSTTHLTMEGVPMTDL